MGMAAFRKCPFTQLKYYSTQSGKSSTLKSYFVNFFTGKCTLIKYIRSLCYMKTHNLLGKNI